MSIIEGARSHYRLFGPHGLYAITRARLSSGPMEIEIECDGVLHPLYLRLRTTDVSLFEEIIVNAEYAIETSCEPTIIVDAGANIGLTSVYFANRYPRARIIAIEPESGNYAMLIKNTARYANVIPVKAALWKSNASVSLEDPGTGNWGFQTAEYASIPTSDSAVRGLTVDTLMREYDLDYIHILKIDIEGAEKEVFESCAAWIDCVGILIVELHDRYKSGCSRSVYMVVKDFPEEWMHGETTFFSRSGHCVPHSADGQGISDARTRPITSILARPKILAAH